MSLKQSILCLLGRHPQPVTVKLRDRNTIYAECSACGRWVDPLRYTFIPPVTLLEQLSADNEGHDYPLLMEVGDGFVVPLRFDPLKSAGDA